MSKPPWALGGADPIAERLALAERFERLVDHALVVYRRYPHTRLPVLLFVAAALDGLRLDVSPDEVDLVADAELAAAAGRASIDLDALSAAEHAELRGFMSAVRGAAGEQWVLDRLAARDLPMPDDTVGVELLDFTQPGADLVFMDAAGETLGAANVKIASSAAVVVQHLDRYSDSVPIVYASSDAAASAQALGYEVVGAGSSLPRTPVVVDIGRPSTAFDEAITDALHDVDPAGEFDLDDVPWLSAGMIGVRALRRLQAGATRAETLREAGRDTARSGSALGAAKLATELGAPEPLTAVAAMTAAWTTHAAMEVRRAWRQHESRDVLLAELADQVAGGWR